jgi:tRNA A37 threonylcarbamoyladenosine biosynthesis protein TsaE
MWKVDSPEVFERLELETLLKPNTIMVIEWWSQVAQYFLPTLSQKHIPCMTVSLMEEPVSPDKNERARILAIQENI